MDFIKKILTLFEHVPSRAILFLSFVLALFSAVVLSFLNYKVPSALSFLILFLFLSNFLIFVLDKGSLLYLLKRLLGAGFLLLIIATLSFFALRTLPGGPFDQERALPPAIKKNIEAKYHLDLPLYMQYFKYMQGLSQGNLGESFKYTDQNVSDIIKNSLPVSVQLGLYALILAYLVGIPLGVFAASRHNTISDRISMILAISGISLPSFLLAPVLIMLFGFYLGWLDVAFWEGPSHYVLPVIILATGSAAIIARLTRASVLDVIQSDYIRTATAKGLHPAAVLYKHVLKNAFIPVLTLSGPIIAGLLTGSFIIEQIFSIPGISKHIVQSVSNRDYPLTMGCTLVYSLLLISSNLVVDFLYSYFDPRIKIAK